MRAGSPWNWMRCARHGHPSRQRFVVREKFQRQPVGAIDVFRIARERRPAERPAPFAKQRPDVFGHEAGDVVGVLHAGLGGLGADVIAVIEGHRAALLQRQHGLHVHAHGVERARQVIVRIARA